MYQQTCELRSGCTSEEKEHKSLSHCQGVEMLSATKKNRQQEHQSQVGEHRHGRGSGCHCEHWVAEELHVEHG
jgi:hypothetical protein